MVATKALPVATALPSVFYEEPEPVEDGMQQADTIMEVGHLLKDYFRGRPDVYVFGGGFIFYDITETNLRVAPDIYIVFEVDLEDALKDMRNYLVWEAGKPPDFVLEVASPSTADNDLGHKRDLYAQLGIQEYWRLDPTGGELYGQPLTGERLVDGVYEPFELNTDADGAIWAYSEVLDVRFHWDEELEDLFDVRDPETGLTTAVKDVERRGRLAAEARELAERAERLAAEARERAEREARDAAETRERAEREARLAAEARERQLRAEIERLRGEQPPRQTDKPKDPPEV